MLIQQRPRAILIEEDLVSENVLISLDKSLCGELPGGRVADVEEDVFLEATRKIICNT